MTDNRDGREPSDLRASSEHHAGWALGLGLLGIGLLGMVGAHLTDPGMTDPAEQRCRGPSEATVGPEAFTRAEAAGEGLLEPEDDEDSIILLETVEDEPPARSRSAAPGRARPKTVESANSEAAPNDANFEGRSPSPRRTELGQPRYSEIKDPFAQSGVR